MKFIKRLLLLLISGALIYYGGGFYLKVSLEKQEDHVQTLYNNADWQGLLLALKKIKPRKALLSFLAKPREFVFLKALSLEKTGKNTDALKYWEYILRESWPEKRFSAAAKLYKGIAEYKYGNEEKAFALLSESYNSEVDDSSLYAAYHLAVIFSDREELDKTSAFIADIVAENGLSRVPQELKKLAGEINIKRLKTRKLTSNSIDYVIKPGDTLGLIAAKNNTTVDLIKITNKMENSVIRPNNHLKVVNSQFSIVVNKTINNMLVYENGKFFKEYKVGTGRDNVTPVGDFIITSKQKNPTWYKHDGKVIPFGSKENLLGTRWMAINHPGYGIHGTWDDDSVGKQSSAGCIRLRNADVEELYSFIPEKTTVSIVE